MNNDEQIRIALSDLVLWDENARLPSKYSGQSEEQIIRYFCQDKNFKIKELAKALVKNSSLLQMDRLIVLKHNSENVVYEGNRRLTVYKLLNNPDLAPDEKWQNWFKEQKKNINISDDFLLDCIVAADEDTAYEYIEQKHLAANNVVSWGEQERTKHKISRGKGANKETRRAGIEKIIRGLSTKELPEDVKDKILGRGYVSTLWRILDSALAAKKYEYKITDNELIIGNASFKQELIKIINHVYKKQDSEGKIIDSRTMNKKGKMKQYLESVTENSKPKLFKPINEESKPNDRDNPRSAARKYLIPSSFSVKIYKPRINNIYLELKENLLIDDSEQAVPNAVGVLFRVFLETSLDYFWYKRGVTFSQEKKTANISSKITKTADYMENKKWISKGDLVAIRKVATKGQHYLSITNFHEYAHSNVINPEPSGLKLKWDDLQEFFRILLNNMEDK